MNKENKKIKYQAIPETRIDLKHRIKASLVKPKVYFGYRKVENNDDGRKLLTEMVKDQKDDQHFNLLDNYFSQQSINEKREEIRESAQPFFTHIKTKPNKNKFHF